MARMLRVRLHGKRMILVLGSSSFHVNGPLNSVVLWTTAKKMHGNSCCTCSKIISPFLTDTNLAFFALSLP